MINDREKEILFYLRFVYVHSATIMEYLLIVNKKGSKVAGTIIALTFELY